MRRILLTIVLSGFVTPCAAQMPAISTNWVEVSVTQEQCFSIADSVLRKTGHVRIERVGASTFGDTPDRQSQVVIRCEASKKIAFVVVAGGNGDDKTTTAWAQNIKENMLRSLPAQN